MPTVLVHGHPETGAIWRPLLAELDGLAPPPILLSPPGYGAPLPDGFPATITAYRDWLAGELERFGEPVDLVGHDWGGGHVLNVVMTRPELVRSWVSDVLGAYEPDYVWHEYAQREQSADGPVVSFGGDADARAARLVQFGMTEEVAKEVAGGQDEAMSRAAHALYKSAAQPVMAGLGRGLERAALRPGLGILATEDRFVGSVEQRLRAAGRAGARTARLDGLGHWWMLQDPGLGARVLAEFWGALGG